VRRGEVRDRDHAAAVAGSCEAALRRACGVRPEGEAIHSRALTQMCRRLSGLALGPAGGSPRTNPVSRPTPLATEQLVCMCNLCLPPGGSPSEGVRAAGACLYSGHPAPINTLAIRSVYQPRRPGALRSTRKPLVQGRCRVCRWERERELG
jgi:hypothetical protein